MTIPSIALPILHAVVPRVLAADAAHVATVASSASMANIARTANIASAVHIANAVHTAPQLLLLLVVLCDFATLATTRLSTCIRALAVQGLLLGVLPLVVDPALTVHAVVLALGTVAVKAVVLPRFLAWAIREAAVRREVEPRVGFVASLLLGAAAVALAFAIAARLPLPGTPDALLVPAALATVMIGFIVLTTRRKAITQVVGYLMLENGIYLFGLTQTASVPFLLDLGVLLDVFVGVFVMGIVLFHINREFDSLDSTNLTELGD